MGSESGCSDNVAHEFVIARAPFSSIGAVLTINQVKSVLEKFLTQALLTRLIVVVMIDR
jgi:hypothetical protein